MSAFICKDCNQPKTRQKHPTEGKYADSRGYSWAGGKCPDCVREYKREWTRRKRAAVKKMIVEARAT